MNEEQESAIGLCSDEEFFKRFWNFIGGVNMTPAKAHKLYKILLENIKASGQLAKDFQSDEFTRQARHLAICIAAGLGGDIEAMSFENGTMPETK